MGRTKGSTNKDFKKVCENCHRKLSSIQFYNTNSVLSGDGKLGICKKCVKKIINYDDMNTVYQILKQMDIPFYYNYWKSAKEKKPDDPWSVYIRVANSKLNEFKYGTWKDSSFEAEIDSDETISNKLEDENIDLDAMQEKWGYGYSKEQYVLFEKKYKKLSPNYNEKTELHTENFLTYIRFRVLEEMSTASGDLDKAKKLAEMADKAAERAKINVNQLSKSDISGGIDVTCQLMEAIESEASIIPLLPKLTEQPYDDADMIIWRIINYYQRLEDKPMVSYRDIWDFYDKSFKEYWKSKGLNSKQIEEERKKRNAIFKDLGQVYKEPLYEDSDQ